MNEEYLKKYCELIIKVGVNLYKGQCLLINCGTGNSEFAVRLAETAYQYGAKYVEINIINNYLNRVRIDNTANEADLNYFPNYLIGRNYDFIANDWAMIRIDNLEEMDALSGVDPDKYGIFAKKEFEKNKAMSEAVTATKICWCIAAVPGPNWAAKVLNTSASDKVLNDFTEKWISVMRLDRKDPIAEWRMVCEKLIHRSGALNNMKLDKLIFSGEGTNLEIGLSANSVWKSGLNKAKNGREFLANIPTEEVFTTPDYKRTNGKVKVTKPVRVMEIQLTGIWFEFKEGKVIDFGADSQKEILEKYFSIDEGARCLGEVALVDKSSEVHKSGLIFNSILYDENAACHIALGKGIAMCFSNREELNTPDEMLKNGCNYSLVHTDFMIGSDDIGVTGVDFNGKETEIITNGEFKF
ncbi:MAG: aminopeptidase [Bacteroidota bacterium]|nr:aminopeptidase [Bacteroidota bacterium]